MLLFNNYIIIFEITIEVICYIFFDIKQLKQRLI